MRLFFNGYVQYEHLSGSIFGDAGDKDRIVCSVPARCSVDADVAAVFAFRYTFAANEGAVAASIYGVIVFIAFCVAVDKPVSIGGKRNVGSGFWEYFWCAYLTDDLFLVDVIANLLVPFRADDDIALVPFGMASDELVVQGKACAVCIYRTWRVDLVAFVFHCFAPSAPYVEVNHIAVAVPKRVVDEQACVVQIRCDFF